jgi:NNP family nitrate/nitrite transporter-like MFS transporter
MSNISFFFPRRMQGLALGLNAGLGNLGVSLMQFLIPWVITFELFGAAGGPPQECSAAAGAPMRVWVQNAGLVWVPVLIFLAIAAWLAMNNLPQHAPGSTASGLGRFLWFNLLGLGGAALGVVLLSIDWGAFPQLLKILVTLVATVALTLALLRALAPRDAQGNLARQFAIFGNAHTWVMTWLYTMTFGSFIGYANSFPLLIDIVFGQISVGPDGEILTRAIANPHAPHSASYIWIGAAVGALIRPVGGWLSDRLGGARVTQYDTWIMLAATILAGWFVARARACPTPENYLLPFLVTFVVLFATTGIGNGSTFRMIPLIFPKEQAGPVLGWTSAIAAYGAYLIPNVLATQIKAGRPEYAVYGFAVFYASCLAVNWWFYARKNAAVRC